MDAVFRVDAEEPDEVEWTTSPEGTPADGTGAEFTTQWAEPGVKYSVTAEDETHSDTATADVVGITRIEYRTLGMEDYSLAEGTICVPVNSLIEFRAVKDPEEAEQWPSGYPVWNLGAGVETGEEVRCSFSSASASLSAGETVSVRCGESEKSVSVVVVDVDHIEYVDPDEGWTPADEPLVIPVGTNIAFRAVAAPEGVDWPPGTPFWGGEAEEEDSVPITSVQFDETCSSATAYKEVTVACGGNTKTANVLVLGVGDLQYKIGQSDPWRTAVPGLSVAVGTTVHFRAVRTPEGGSWPIDKPLWTGLNQQEYIGDTFDITFNDVSSSADATLPISVECGNTKHTEVLVVGLDSLTANDTLLVDDKDANPDTQSYLFLVHDSASGDITITATPTPVVSEEQLPVNWTLSGGTGTSPLIRTVSKTSPAKTEITCTAGSCSKRATIWVVSVEVTELGFKGDHMITRWPSGVKVDDPDGSSPVWPAAAGSNAPVCFTTGTSPTMFAKFSVSPEVSPSIDSIKLQALCGGPVVGLAGNCRLRGTTLEDSDNGQVNTIQKAGAQFPFSQGVRTSTVSVRLEISADSGSTWSHVGTAGVTTYWISDTPKEAPLYELAIQKACTYVAGNAGVLNKIRQGIHGELTYDPGDPNIDANPLTVYGGGGQVCADFANLMAYLARSVGFNAETEVYWGGIVSDNGHRALVYANLGNYPVTLEHVMPGDYTFVYHAIANVEGSIYDAALNAAAVQATAIHDGKTIYWLDIAVTAMPEATLNSPYSRAISRRGKPVGLLHASTGALIPTNHTTTFSTINGYVTGGYAPVSWSITSDRLPAGLTLDASIGVISGTPTETGHFSFTVRVTDANHTAHYKDHVLSIDVVNPP